LLAHKIIAAAISVTLLSTFWQVSGTIVQNLNFYGRTLTMIWGKESLLNDHSVARLRAPAWPWRNRRSTSPSDFDVPISPEHAR
jgi:hypothetical protein